MSIGGYSYGVDCEVERKNYIPKEEITNFNFYDPEFNRHINDKKHENN